MDPIPHGSPETRRRRPRRELVRTVLLYLGVAVVLGIFLLPIVWTLMTALKTHVDAWSMPPKWIFSPSLDNFRIVLFDKRFLAFGANSAIIALGSTALSLTLGSLTAYGIERFRVPGRDVIFFAFFWAYMVPAIVIAVPLYLVAAEARLLDSHLMLILAHSTFNTAFTTWMMRGFFREVPPELEGCALIDGCTPFGAFWRITLPLAAPGLAVTAVFCFMYSWNDFPYALVLSGFATKTLPVAVGTLETPFGTFWGQVAASAFVAVIPIFVFTVFVQRWLIRGLTFGAVK